MAASASSWAKALAAGFSDFADAGLANAGLKPNLISASVTGGIGAVLGGGKFENGALTGAFGYLFNAAAGRFAGRLVGGAVGEIAGLGPEDPAADAAALVLGKVFGEWGSDLEDWIFSPSKPPDNAWDPNGPKAPGYPGVAPEDGGHPDFVEPKGGPNWLPNPNGNGNGWQSADGSVWVPTGKGALAHGGPHWDVQLPRGGYANALPGGGYR